MSLRSRRSSHGGPPPLAHAAPAHVPPRRGRALPELRVRGGQEHLTRLDHVREDSRADPRVQLGQGIVQQQDRRAAHRLRDGTALGQPQGQRHQPLLAARAEAPEVARIELDHEVVAVRPHQRHPPARLLAEPALEGAAESVLGRVVAKRAPVREPHLAPARQLRIQPLQLPRQRPDRQAPPAEQLAAHPHQLLVPRLEPRAQLRRVEPPLKEVITPTQDLPVPAPRRQVGRVELPREAVDEVTPRLGRAMKDRHVRPAERNDASPRTAFPGDRPAPVLALLDHAPQTSRALPAPQLARQHRGLGRVPAGQLGRPRPAKGTPDQQDSKPRQQGSLRLGIRGRQDLEARRRREGESGEIPKIGNLYARNMHPISAPMRTQILIGMITQSEPSSSKLLTTPGLNPSFTSSTTCSLACAPSASSTYRELNPIVISSPAYSTSTCSSASPKSGL